MYTYTAQIYKFYIRAWPWDTHTYADLKLSSTNDALAILVSIATKSLKLIMITYTLILSNKAVTRWTALLEDIGVHCYVELYVLNTCSS